MYAQDSTIIIISLVAFLTFIPYVMTFVVDLAPTRSIKLLIVGAGVLCCLFGAASLFAVLAHLKKNKNKLYREEINASPSKGRNNSLWVQVIDSLFVMILCFATLLTAMLINKGSVGGISYSIHVLSLVVTVAGLFFYLYYLLKQSDKGLKSMIQHIYGKK